MATVGQNVRRLRERVGFASQAALAHAAGMSLGQVSDLEADRYQLPDTKTLLKLAKVLKCSVDDLLEEVDSAYASVLKETDPTQTAAAQTSRFVASASPGAGKKGRGRGKSIVRQKLTDMRGAMLTVQRQKRSDGSFLVKVVHLEKEGAEAKTGMVTTHPNEQDATKKFDELVTLAQKAGWTLVQGKKGGKIPTSEFNTMPQAAK